MSTKYRRELTNRHYQVFVGALVVMFLHLAEDALVHKESGSSIAAHYPLLWPRVRPLLVVAYGALALLAGWRAHVTDVLDGDAAGGDYTGTVFALAGLALVGLSLKLAADTWRGGPSRPRARDAT